jgi:hypothetical protein
LIGPEKGVANRAETRCNARLWQGRETVETGDLAPSRHRFDLVERPKKPRYD